ncbi:MAG TPA: M20/M25/M40 family metallo-hydrolase [Solirubrobacteraceae bacterium]|nr:M20/M25/M40 family metallo-hydrolase [Solirubrobacteraceae bacterium]
MARELHGVGRGAHRQREVTLHGLDERERALVRFARRLVATPSLSGEEHQVARLVASELRRLGYRNVTVDRAGNVLGSLGPGRARLMFNGHLDHVPPAGMLDPYDARIELSERPGGSAPVLRGRGSCDMKANVAAGVYAAAFLEPETKLQAAFVFTADVQEETDSPAGVRALLAEGLRADYGISGEATELGVAVGHRGKAQFDVIVAGRASHASTPELGSNAVFRAVPFLRALEQAQAGLGDDPLFGPATLTVTRIESQPHGDVAVVPSACVIRVDRRYLPGESAESAHRELQAIVAQTAERERVPARVELVDDYPLMSTPLDDPVVAAGRDAVAAVMGESPTMRTWRFGVNATFMNAAGIPSIGIGAGDESCAHTDEEHVDVDQLVASSRIYAELIRRLCT